MTIPQRCLFLVAVILGAVAVATPSLAAKSALMIQASDSPIINFRILFQTGAAHDPVGQEGVASLTAALLAKGGSKSLAYEEIVRKMYPIATSFEWQVDKEMSVFVGATHVDNLEVYYGLISQMLLDPGFREDDFKRLKEDAINFLKVSLRDGNDEEFGKERLYGNIYGKHPYGHHNMGTVSSLEKLTLDHVRQFYKSEYVRPNLRLAISGRLTDKFIAQLDKDFDRLPSGSASRLRLPPPAKADELDIEILERETRSTAISIGFPISVHRGDPDYAALLVATYYFGQHRSSNSHLYQRLREARGLNYGDYSYIEYFPRGMFQFQPDANLARQQQIFQIWIRPVQPQHGHFALRAAFYELDQLTEKGISAENFEVTRTFLGKFVDVLMQTPDARLGYDLDSQFYGIGGYRDYLRKELGKLTLAKVNAAIKKHLRVPAAKVVIITKDAKALRESIAKGETSPMSYIALKPPEILTEDKVIEKYTLPKGVEKARVTPASAAFE